MTMYHDNFDGTKPFSDNSAQINLVTTTEQTYTVPGTSNQKYRALFTFSQTANIYVGLNVAAASPPAGTNTTTANLEFRPSEPKFVKGGDVIHFATPDATGAYVGISLLAIPG